MLFNTAKEIPIIINKLEDLKKTWMAKSNNDAIFISALNKTHFEELRALLYERIKELHIKRYPYNNFLY